MPPASPPALNLCPSADLGRNGEGVRPFALFFFTHFFFSTLFCLPSITPPFSPARFSSIGALRRPCGRSRASGSNSSPRPDGPPEPRADGAELRCGYLLPGAARAGPGVEQRAQHRGSRGEREQQPGTAAGDHGSRAHRSGTTGRLDQSGCSNYDTPNWVNTGQPPARVDETPEDPTRDKTNMIVYIICGVVAIMVLVGIFTKLGLEKAQGPQTEMTVSR